MIIGKPARKCVARAKGLASAEKYYGIKVPNVIYRGMLKRLSPRIALINEGFARRIGVSLTELEQALVNVEELQNQPSRTGGYSLTAGFRTWSSQEGRRGGRGGRNSSKGRDNEAHGRNDG